MTGPPIKHVVAVPAPWKRAPRPPGQDSDLHVLRVLTREIRACREREKQRALFRSGSEAGNGFRSAQRAMVPSSIRGRTWSAEEAAHA